MRREIVGKILNKLYPERKIRIIDYEIHERNVLNDKCEWVMDTPAIFLTLSLNDKEDKIIKIDESMGETLSLYTGYDFHITRI